MEVSRQTPAELAQARKQLSCALLFGDLEGSGSNKVKIDFFALFQIKRPHQGGRKSDCQ